MARVFIAGTGVGPTVAERFYRPLTTELGASLLTLSWNGWAHTESSARKVMERLVAMDEKVTLYGHSQGGLVASLVGLWLPEYVEQVVSICGPLAGTPLAPSWGYFPPSVSCMSNASALVKDLQGAVADGEYPTKLVTVAGRRDRIVPARSALLGPEQHLFHAGHLDIIRNYEMRLTLLLPF